MVLLTGTPAPNGLLDLWSQSYLIDQGVTLGRNITAYRNRFFTTDYMGYSYEPRSDAKENIEALIAPYTLSMQAEDYLTLPSRLDTVVEIDIPLAAMKAYIEFKKEMYIDFHGNDFEALNAATLANKLLQFANGAVYTDELKNFSTVHDSKLDALKDIIDDNPNENILLAYNFKSDLIRLKKKFPELVVLSKEGKELEKWNCGKIKLMACHPASAGHGLNLQGGAAMMVWFGLNWSLELYQQFCARLHRQGQTRPVKVIHLIAKNTIDEKVMSVLLDKEAIQTSLLKALN
jgi:SNF2 family DNA or RNA helicase